MSVSTNIVYITIYQEKVKELSPTSQFPANLSVLHIHPYILSLDGWTFPKKLSYPIRSAGKHPTFLRIWRKSRGLFFPFYPLLSFSSLWWRDMEGGGGAGVRAKSCRTRSEHSMSVLSVKVRLVSGESSSHISLFIIGLCKD